METIFKISNNKHKHIPLFDKENIGVVSRAGLENTYKVENGFVYIYVLYDEYNKMIFYIGKTINPIERLNAHWKHETYKEDKIKYRKIEFLKKEDLILYLEIIDTVPLNEWKFWEKHYISLYKSWGFNLANQTNGGEGIDGYKHTKESIEKITESSTGRKHKEKSKKSISESRLGIIFSENHIKNLSLSHIGQVHKSLLKPVVQIDCFTGNIINEFKSIKEAELKTGICNPIITKCCKGKVKRAGGYYWCYKSEFKNFVFKEFKRDIHIPITKKEVHQIDSSNGSVIKIHRSIRAASIFLNKGTNGRSNILYSIKKNKLAFGYKWELLNN